MENWTKSVAVVTGANSGNGFAIFQKLAESNLTVVGIDIRVDAIENYKKTTGAEKLFSIVCDITKDKETEDAFKWIEENLGGVDIMVNNAGIFKNIGILDHEKPMSELAQVIEVNFTGMVRCSRLAFKSMQKRDSFGYIICINSIAGHFVPRTGGVKMGTYPGTKYAITATTEVMRQELIFMGNTKVRVSNISPGLVKTNIFKAANIPQEITDRFMENSLEPENIGDTVCYLLSLPHSVNVNEIIIRATGSEF
jgi:NADP+-dependent farnesol dehydrogenase